MGHGDDDPARTAGDLPRDAVARSQMSDRVEAVSAGGEPAARLTELQRRIAALTPE